MGPGTFSIPENFRPDFNLSEITQQDRKVRDFGHENTEEQRCSEVEDLRQ